MKKGDRICTVELIDSSPSAEVYGKQIKGKINGRENDSVITDDDDFMNDVYSDGSMMPIVTIEAEDGRLCRVPEEDVQRIYC